MDRSTVGRGMYNPCQQSGQINFFKFFQIQLNLLRLSKEVGPDSVVWRALSYRQ